MEKGKKEGRKSNNLNVHPFEVVSRYRDPPLQVNENFSYLVVKGLTLLIGLENATDADIMLV